MKRLLTFAVLLPLLQIANAEVITLNDGSKVKGKVINVTDNSIYIEGDDGVKVIGKNKVQSVGYGGDAAVAAKPEIPQESGPTGKLRNPDRFPSLGINYTAAADSGDYKTLGVSQDLETSGRSLILDGRLPVSDSVTLSMALGGTASTVTGKENAFFNGSESKTSGGIFSIGARYYFNH